MPSNLPAGLHLNGIDRSQHFLARLTYQFPKVSHQRGELGIFSDFGFDDAHEVFRGLEKRRKSMPREGRAAMQGAAGISAGNAAFVLQERSD
jgi:hypothetical protein